MPWFAAHVLETTLIIDGAQSQYPVWENIMVFEAPDHDTVWDVAEEVARKRYGHESESLSLEGRPAQRRLVGIRRVVFILDKFPASGAEVSYLHYHVPDLESMEKLMCDEQIEIRFDESVEKPKPAGTQA